MTLPLGSFCADCTSLFDSSCHPFSPPFSLASSSSFPFLRFSLSDDSVNSETCRCALNEDHSAVQTFSTEHLSESLRVGNVQASSEYDVQTFLWLLRECCDSRDLAEGKLLHQRIIDSGYSRNRLLTNTLIQMYGRCGAFPLAVDVFTGLQEKNIYTWTIMVGACIDCGKIKDAIEIFDQSPERNLVGWNVIILACVEHGLRSRARKYYQRLLQECTPDKITFLNILPLCEDIDELNQIHSHISDTGLDCDTTVANSLLNMYHKRGNLSMAEQMFKRVPQPDIYTWNTMISALAQREQEEDAFRLFTEMQKEGLFADCITYVGLIDVCTANLDSSRCMSLHQHVVNDGFESDLIVSTALINMYGKCSHLNLAKTSFNKIVQRDLIAWNALMDAYAQQGQSDNAFRLLTQMQSEGFLPDCATFVSLLASYISPKDLDAGKHVHSCIELFGFEVDATLSNSLLNMYGKCGSFDDAFVVFNQMTEQNLISWNTMINACAQCKQEKVALELFQEMIKRGMIPDGVTFLAVIDACTNQANLSEAKYIHSYVERFGLVLDAMISSALMKMYSKCGSLEDIQRVFDETPFKDVVLWNTIISSYAQHGHGERALQIFEQMKTNDVKPNEATLSIVLSACTHAGLASRGRQYFLEFSHNYGILPTMEHFNFLLDLFGRSGQISDVENLIERMPVEPNKTSWMTFYSACTKHMDTKAEESVADRAVGHDSSGLTQFTLCGNVLQT